MGVCPLTCALFAAAKAGGIREIFTQPKAQHICFPLGQGQADACLIPLTPKQMQKEKRLLRHLHRALDGAQQAGCRFFALSPGLLSLLPNRSAALRDGNLYLLSFLPACLDADLGPDWRYRRLVLAIDSAFMAKAAMVLARESRYLHLYAPPSAARERLAATIYQENGLICTMGRRYGRDSLFIASPTASGPAPQSECWCNWRRAAHLPELDRKIPPSWTEALLLDNMEWEKRQRFFHSALPQKLHLLKREAQKQGLLPA